MYILLLKWGFGIYAFSPLQSTVNRTSADPCKLCNFFCGYCHINLRLTFDYKYYIVNIIIFVLVHDYNNCNSLS